MFSNNPEAYKKYYIHNDFYDVDQFIEDTVRRGCYAYEYLEQEGWVRVMAWGGELRFSFTGKHINPKQKKAVQEYCQKYSLDLPSFIIR